MSDSGEARPRLCHACGERPPRGPRARYCDRCRVEVRRTANRRAQARARLHRVDPAGTDEPGPVWLPERDLTRAKASLADLLAASGRSRDQESAGQPARKVVDDLRQAINRHWQEMRRILPPG